MRTRLKVILLVATLAVVACVALVLCYTPNDDVKHSSIKTTSTFGGLTATISKDSLCEVILDYGDVPYGATATEHIRFTNDTLEPIALLNYTATCRCVWIDLPSKAIAPGEYGEVAVHFDSRGEFGSVGNYLTIETSDSGCKVAIWMSAEVE